MSARMDFVNSRNNQSGCQLGGIRHVVLGHQGKGQSYHEKGDTHANPPHDVRNNRECVPSPARITDRKANLCLSQRRASAA